MLSGLNHLTLAVTDLQRSFDFYRTVLGFRPHALWSRGAYLSVGQLWLCLSLDPALTGVQRQGHTHYAFSVSPQDFKLLVQTLHGLSVPE